ncbi:restriction endonuclease subunit S [Weissella paramesenteroides]|uniref:restriction endonuclease subunit S n=1 Tax=Weissella paramesenteroides TaxID=1249 RepID=UPI001126915A|nr:restriction endonuclease subunit S [Weissella paramesenteroides]TPF03345.1 restriction endonuclease subunit S [Weissella paramesenteroides]
MNRKPLSELVKIISGGTPKRSIHEYWNGSIPWISVKDLHQGKHIYRTERFITESGLKNSPTKLLIKDDIIISARGTVGLVSMINEPMAFNQSLFGLRSGKEITAEYLYYWLKLNVSYIKNNVHGSVFDTITRDTFNIIEVTYPSLEEQKRVTEILRLLDKKIEQNHQINDNLLELGSTLWDKYFQFANADKQQSHLMDLGDIVAGGTPSKKNEAFYDGGTIPWITPKDLSNATDTVFINQGKTSITEAGLSGSSAKLMPAGTVLFSSRAPIGYVAIANNPVTTNQGFKSIVPYDDSKTYYLYYLLKKLTPHIEVVAGGSTFKEISGSGMKSIEFPKPDDVSMSEFATLIRPMFSFIRENEQEVHRLTELRNVLLSNLLG